MGLFGVHASIAGGLYHAIEEGTRLKCEAIQIFTANQRQWTVKPVSEEEAEKFRSTWKSSDIKKVVSHNSYLVNLASADKGNLEKSRKTFIEEMERVKALGVDAVIFHPGSHANTTFEKGLQTIIDSLNYCIPKVKDFKSMLLLEITAGSGNSIGSKFEHIAAIIKGVEKEEIMGVCFDTAHAFEAGYDTVNDYEGVFKYFDDSIGLKRLKAFHINDSKTPFDSHSDRHEHIGKGEIGLSFFKKLVNDRRFRAHPMILETPMEGGWDKRNLATLRRLEA